MYCVYVNIFNVCAAYSVVSSLWSSIYSRNIIIISFLFVFKYCRIHDCFFVVVSHLLLSFVVVSAYTYIHRFKPLRRRRYMRDGFMRCTNTSANTLIVAISRHKPSENLSACVFKQKQNTPPTVRKHYMAITIRVRDCFSDIRVICSSVRFVKITRVLLTLVASALSLLSFAICVLRRKDYNIIKRVYVTFV